MLQNIEMMKKTDSIEKASGLVVKGQSGRSKSKGLKKDSDASSSNASYYCRKPAHIKKICMKFKDV